MTTNFNLRDLGYLTCEVMKRRGLVPRQCPPMAEARRMVAEAESEPWFTELLADLARWYEKENRRLLPWCRYRVPEYLRAHSGRANGAGIIG